MTENTEHVTAVRNMTDIIAVIPAMLGSQITLTGKAVMLIGKGGHVQGAMAADLPDSGTEALRTLDLLMTQARNIEADDAFLVLYPKSDPGDAEEVALGLFALGFGTGLEDAGIDVPGMAMVAPTYWRNYRDPEVRRDLADISSSAAAADFALAGNSLNSPAVTIPEPDLATTTLTLRALDFGFSLPVMRHDALTVRDRKVLADATALWHRVVESGGDLTEESARQLIGYFQHKTIRDGLVAHLAGDEFDPDQFEAIMTRAISDPEVTWLPRAKAMVTALRSLMRWTEPKQRVNMLAVAGFCEWFMGRGTQAGMYWDEAERIDPAHRLTSLLNEVAKRFPLSKAIMLPGARDYADIINK